MRIAGAVLALILVAGCQRVQPPPLPDVIPLIPTGRVERVTEFRWQGPADGGRFKLTVTDPGGVPILIRETTETRLIIERDESAVFQTGGYSWYIETLGENGEVVLRSATKLFDVD